MSARLRVIPGIVFAFLVILFALGNSWVGTYPYGTAVWVRPMLGLLGIIGAAMMILGIGWWRLALLAWCLLQTWVIATDPSGEWFYQGIFAGFRSTQSTRSNQMLIDYQSHGINFAGLAIAVILLVIMALHLHPRIRRPITRRQLVVAVALLPSIGFASWGSHEAAAATFVLDLDLPSVPIYYQGKLLGRTPLFVTPEKIKQWGLPLHDFDSLRMYSWGWADAQILSDGQTHLPLYAGVPAAFADKLDTLDSPWGQRARMHSGHDDGKMQQGQLWRKAELRGEPVLTIELLNPSPVRAGDVLHLRCLLTNPTPRSYSGAKAEIERYFFSFNRRRTSPTTAPRPINRFVVLPTEWNTLAPGAKLSADVDFDGPTLPDAYELFCTFDLFKQPGSDNLVGGSVYSNMLLLNVSPVSTTQPN